MTTKQSFRHFSFLIASYGVLSLSFLFTSCHEQIASQNLKSLDYIAVQIDENDSWSIMDKNGKIAIDREYSANGSVSKIYPKGVFWVRHNDKYNLFSIESCKKAINKQEFDQVTDFVNDRAFASVIGEPIVLLNSKGEVIKTLSPDINTVFCFRDGLAKFIAKNGNCGFLNTNGDIAVAPEYYNVSDFNNGIAYTLDEKMKTSNIIDRVGTTYATLNIEKTKPYYYASEDKLGVAIDYQSNSPSIVYIDDHGKEVMPRVKGFDCPEPFINNYAVVVNTNDGEGAVINEKGEIVIRKGKYVLLTNFGNATFGGRKGDKFGVVNQEDNPIIKFEYDAMSSYLLGENYLMKSGNYYALVNAQGEEIKDSEVRNISLWESGSADFIDIKSKAEAFLENIYPKGYKMFNGKVDAPSIAKALNLKLDSIDLYSNRLGISRTFEGGNILVQIEVDFDNYLKAEKFHEETTNDGWFEKTETVSDGYDWNANTTMTSLRQQIDIDIKYQDNFIDLIKKMIEKRGFKKHKNDRYYYVGENDKQIRIYIEKSDTSPAVVLTYYPQGSFIYE